MEGKTSAARAEGRRSNSVWHVVALLGQPVLVVGSICSWLAMAALILIGLWEIKNGVWDYFRSRNAATAIEYAVHGIEFLFLAPLSYLILEASAKYLASGMPPRGSNFGDQATDTAAPSRNASSRTKPLLEVKAFTVALIIAVIATDLVSRVLSRGGLTYEAAVSGALVITVLAAYFVALEWLASDKQRK